MSEECYNGWTNYATWGVALILGNDQGMEEACATMTRVVAMKVRDGEEEYPAMRLAKMIEDFTRELCGQGDNDLGIPEPSLMASQLLGAALSEVNFREIADHYIADYDDGAIAGNGWSIDHGIAGEPA
jgi:hypothetical protein